MWQSFWSSDTCFRVREWYNRLVVTFDVTGPYTLVFRRAFGSQKLQTDDFPPRIPRVKPDGHSSPLPHIAIGHSSSYSLSPGFIQLVGVTGVNLCCGSPSSNTQPYTCSSLSIAFKSTRRSSLEAQPTSPCVMTDKCPNSTELPATRAFSVCTLSPSTPFEWQSLLPFLRSASVPHPFPSSSLSWFGTTGKVFAYTGMNNHLKKHFHLV